MPDLSEMTPERRAAINFGRKFDWTIAGVIVVLAVLFIIMLQSLPQRATFFPWFITISILIVGGTYAFGKIRNPERWDAQYDPDTEPPGDEHDVGPAYLVPYRHAILRSLVTFLALVLATMAVGPKYAVPVFVALMLIINGENKIVAVLSGIAFYLVLHFVFGRFMSINLPPGIFVNPF